jgi:hypothetical protein
MAGQSGPGAIAAYFAHTEFYLTGTAHEHFRLSTGRANAYSIFMLMI